MQNIFFLGVARVTAKTGKTGNNTSEALVMCSHSFNLAETDQGVIKQVLEVNMKKDIVVYYKY